MIAPVITPAWMGTKKKQTWWGIRAEADTTQSDRDEEHCLLTFFKHQQAHTGRASHYVRGVLGVAGEGAIVAEIQVFDQDGAITAIRVPHKLQPVPEGALVVNVGLTAGVVEDLDEATETLLFPFVFCSHRKYADSFCASLSFDDVF